MTFLILWKGDSNFKRIKIILYKMPMAGSYEHCMNLHILLGAGNFLTS